MRIAPPAVLAALALLLVTPSAAAAYPRPGLTIRLSESSEGQEADAFSRAGVVSGDGNVVAFVSMASNLVPGDTNGTFDVFVRDLRTGEVERVSVSSQGEQADGPSFLPSVSGDGRVVAFASTASNLAPGDAGSTQDVFVHDRQTGETDRITRRAGEVDPRAEYWTPRISADGSRVAFYEHIPSTATEFTKRQVFLHDLAAGETTLASKSSAGTPANNLAHEPAISADGRFVAFSSGANNLVPGDTNSAEDVFIHDTETGATELVSISSSGAQGNLWSLEPSVSADGRFVAFTSAASTLVPGDANETWDVFVRDRLAKTTERVSVASDGAEANERSSSARIDDAGRTIVFVSHASNLVPGDDNGTNDVFVHDRVAGLTALVSIAADGGFANGPSFVPSVSADGGIVGFGSIATDLVAAGGTAGRDHSFVRLHGPPLGLSRLQVEPDGDEVEVSGWATFTGEVVLAADDPPGDAPPVLGAAGGELLGAALAYRPEREDLLVRWRVAEVPAAVGPAGVPGVVYGLDLTTGGIRFRVRGTAPGVFVLERCELGCVPEAQVGGAVGSTGDEVRAAVPLAALGLEEGDPIADVRAFSALGAPEGPSDEVLLPDAAIPARTVELALAPEGTAEEDVAFTDPAPIEAGAVAAVLQAAHLQEPDRVLWIRTCLGGTCTTSRRLLQP